MGGAARGDEHHEGCIAIGKLIRHFRKQRQLTQLVLAEMIGIRFQQIQKYECGAIAATAVQLAAIARALEVPIQNLIPAAMQMQPPRPASKKADAA